MTVTTTPGAWPAAARGAPNDPAGRLLVNATIFGHFLHAASFNFSGLTDGIRLGLAGGILVLHLAMILRARSILVEPSSLLPLAVVLGAPLIALTLFGKPVDAAGLSKLLLLSMAPLTFYAYRHSISLPLYFYLVAASIVAMVTIGIAGYPYYYGDSDRLAPYTGGEGVHPSAYFAMLMVFALFAFWRLRLIGGVLFTTLTLLCIFMLAGYVVRTTYLMMLIFAAAAYGLVVLKDWRSRFALLAMAFVVSLLAYAVVDAAGFNLEHFSSGRLATYAQRVDVISQRDLHSFLFGSGLGTDLFKAGEWKWEQKGAHNDYLHYLIEIGVVGTFGVFLVLRQAWRRADPWGQAFLVSTIVGSAVSNALLDRPQLIAFGLMVVAILAAASDRQQARFRNVAANSSKNHMSPLISGGSAYRVGGRPS